MSTSMNRTKTSNAIMAVGIAFIVLGTSFISAFLSGLLGHSIALDKMTFLGNSIFSWGVILLIAGDIIKLYHKGLTKKTKLLIWIPCIIYLLGYLCSGLIPINRITTLGPIPSYLIIGILVVLSIVFWGALLGGLYRMHRESKEE